MALRGRAATAASRGADPGPGQAPWRRDLPWLLGGLAVLAVVCCFDPAQAGFYPPCPLRWATGWHCPGCGSGRALHQLLHGHLGAAFGLNPALVLALPAVGLGLGALAWTRWRGRPLRRRWPCQSGWLVLLALLAWTLARNLG